MLGETGDTHWERDGSVCLLKINEHDNPGWPGTSEARQDIKSRNVSYETECTGNLGE